MRWVLKVELDAVADIAAMVEVEQKVVIGFLICPALTGAGETAEEEDIADGKGPGVVHNFEVMVDSLLHMDVDSDVEHKRLVGVGIAAEEVERYAQLPP